MSITKTVTVDESTLADGDIPARDLATGDV